MSSDWTGPSVDWRPIVRGTRTRRRRSAAGHGRRDGAAPRRPLRRRPRPRAVAMPRRARARSPRSTNRPCRSCSGTPRGIRRRQYRAQPTIGARRCTRELHVSAPFVSLSASSGSIRRSRSSPCWCSASAPAPHHRLHGRRCGGAAAAALCRARSARHAVGHEHREGARARSDLAGQLHGLPRAAGVQGRGGMVAAGRQPRRSRPGPGARQHNRGQRQPVRGARRRPAGRRRDSRPGGPVLRAQRARSP